MEIDPATRAAIWNSPAAWAVSGAGSLLACLDRTITGAGARLLAADLAAPLTNPEAINQRLDRIAFFMADEALRRTTARHAAAGAGSGALTGPADLGARRSA